MRVILLLIIFHCSLIGFSQSEFLQELSLIDSIGIENNYNKVELDSVSWNEMGLDSLESYNSSFNYYIINKSQREDFNIVIISRTYTEENIHWACIVTSEGKLIDWIRTAYDNSEGFMYMKSRFEAAKVRVFEWNLYTNPNESQKEFVMTKKGFVK